MREALWRATLKAAFVWRKDTIERLRRSRLILTQSAKRISESAFRMLPSRDAWDRLAALFKEAEEALHEAETIHGDLTVPSLNQLRYLGYHVLKAATSNSSYTVDEEFRKATRHCQRAIYDAFDSAVAYLLQNVEQFQKDYSKIEITPHFPSYQEARLKARNAKELLRRAKSAHSERDKYYAECRQVCRELRDCLALMEDAREELNKALKRHNRNVILAWIAIGATLLAGAVGAVASLVAAGWKIWLIS